MESVSTSVIELLFGERLDSSNFVWLNHVAVCGTSTADIFNIAGWPSKREITTSRFKILGWCLGGNLTVRPKTDALGIMFWDIEQNQEVWCHVSKTLVLLFSIRIGIGREKIFNYVN